MPPREGKLTLIKVLPAMVGPVGRLRHAPCERKTLCSSGDMAALNMEVSPPQLPPKTLSQASTLENLPPPRFLETVRGREQKRALSWGI